MTTSGGSVDLIQITKAPRTLSNKVTHPSGKGHGYYFHCTRTKVLRDRKEKLKVCASQILTTDPGIFSEFTLLCLITFKIKTIL